MEESFDLGRLLRNHQKVHKSKPSQFGSLAGGVKKRLENNIKYRKSNRLSYYDNVRDLSRGESPVHPPKVQSKEEHRRQQLEKWKEQKEKQKKEAAAQKKKPFVTGVPHAPLKYIPPPPIQKPKPSTSGRVTRSQSAKVDTKSSESKASNASQSTSKSFAPKNASFRPPEIKKVTTLPKLAPVKTRKDKKQNITFDPILPNVQKENQSRTKALRHVAVDTLPAQNQSERKTKAKGTKPSPKKTQLVKANLQSSSSSEKEQSHNISPIIKTRSSRKSMAAQKSHTEVTKTPKKSMQMEPQLFTPKNLVPKSESSSEERLRAPKSIENAAMTLEEIAEEAKKISPCVTISRGKENARKEMKKKLKEGLLDEDASDMDSVDHFKKQLASEIKRMTEMCETWEKISQQNIMPETVQEAALSAVGQARLLMSQKLQQFAALVEACVRPEPGRALVTPADLHGFWDMVFMQVENVDIRFKKLEELRARNWVEVVEPVAIGRKKKVVKNPVEKVTKPSRAPSQLRDIIAAARKAKKEQQHDTSSAPPSQGAGDSKTFDAGFFSVSSPVKSPAANSPGQGTPGNKNSLLKAVLSNEAQKSATTTASFAMLRASVLAKNMDYEGIAPIPQTPLTPINMYATPGRSILKPSNTDKSTRKSIKVVLFDYSDTESHDTSYLTPDSELNDVLPDEHLDSGVSSMDLEKVENKENSRQKSKLVRRDAVDRSPVLTRSRRKSNQDEVVTPRRSSRKKVLQEPVENVEEIIPQRSSRRRKSQTACQESKIL